MVTTAHWKRLVVTATEALRNYDQRLDNADKRPAITTGIYKRLIETSTTQLRPVQATRKKTFSYHNSVEYRSL